MDTCSRRSDGKIRILFLTNNLGSGGAERVLVNLANQLSVKPEYEVAIRCLSKSGANLKRLSPAVKCESIFEHRLLPRGTNYLYLLPHSCIYQKAVGGQQYDVIIPYLHGVLTRIVSYAPMGQKTVAYLHANMEKSPFIRQLGSKEKIQRVFNTYNQIVAVSEDVRTSFLKVSGMDAGKVIVLYNTFDVDEIRKYAEKSTQISGASDEIRICSVGKLENVKGYKRLINIVNRLITEGIRFHLTIVGEGPERAELSAVLKEYGLEEAVTLAGYDKNPYKYIKNSDLFVCSSYSEGFSSVVAESLILGVPVITTDCAGMKEMLGDNEYGVITENSDDALYKGLKSLLSSSDLLAHYKRKAQERSVFFSPESTVTAFEQMIEKVIHE